VAKLEQLAIENRQSQNPQSKGPSGLIHINNIPRRSRAFTHAINLIHQHLRIEVRPMTENRGAGGSGAYPTKEHAMQAAADRIEKKKPTP